MPKRYFLAERAERVRLLHQTRLVRLAHTAIILSRRHCLGALEAWMEEPLPENAGARAGSGQLQRIIYNT
jgi:hypothetical protein